MSESESARTIRELNEELERWKIEAEEHRQERERWRRESEEHRQERASVEVWQKQISNLERDLEVALFSLQSAEAKVIETKGDQEAASIKFAEYEKTIETMKADLEDQKSTQEKALEETTISHGIKVEGLEARNKGKPHWMLFDPATGKRRHLD
jgi:chromosome segregation ATPase